MTRENQQNHYPSLMVPVRFKDDPRFEELSPCRPSEYPHIIDINHYTRQCEGLTLIDAAVTVLYNYDHNALIDFLNPAHNTFVFTRREKNPSLHSFQIARIGTCVYVSSLIRSLQ